MKFNISKLILPILGLFLISGCAIKKCDIGSNYSNEYDKCLVTNKELKGVVSSIACLGKECKTTIIDERNREFVLDTDDNVKVGDKISIVLYKNQIKQELSDNK